MQGIDCKAARKFLISALLSIPEAAYSAVT